MTSRVKHSALAMAGICLFVSRLSAQDERFYEAWRLAGFTTQSGLPSDRVRAMREYFAESDYSAGKCVHFS